MSSNTAKRRRLDTTEGASTSSHQSGRAAASCSGSNGMEHFRFLMLGKTGSGKSTTGNTILGGRKFVSNVGFSSITADCKMDDTVLNGTHIEVLDTPGMCDTKISDEDTAVLITKAVIGLHPGPHALLYVLKTDRFTDEEYSTFRKLEHIFDKRFTDYLIVIFTGGDNFEHDGTTAEEVIERAPQTLKQLLDDCNNRYVVFNNRATDKRPQVDELLTTVREMVEANGQRPHYRCKRYERLGDNLEQEVRGRVAAVEEKMLQEQEAFKKQMDKKEKEMEKAQKQKEKEFKRKIAKKQMAESEAKKKIKEMEKERERERERMNRERREMEEQHREELRERSRQEERVIRTETVEGGGMFSRIKGGLRRAASGLFDVVTAPFEEIFSW